MKYTAKQTFTNSKLLEILNSSVFQGNIEEFTEEVYRQLAIDIIKNINFEDLKKLFEIDFQEEDIYGESDLLYDGYEKIFDYRIQLKTH